MSFPSKHICICIDGWSCKDTMSCKDNVLYKDEIGM